MIVHASFIRAGRRQRDVTSVAKWERRGVNEGPGWKRRSEHDDILRDQWKQPCTETDGTWLGRVEKRREYYTPARPRARVKSTKSSLDNGWQFINSLPLSVIHRSIYHHHCRRDPRVGFVFSSNEEYTVAISHPWNGSSWTPLSSPLYARTPRTIIVTRWIGRKQ